MKRKNGLHEGRMTAEATINEASGIARRIVDSEAGKCGGNVKAGLFRASQMYGISEGALWSLRYRPQSLKGVKGHILDRLRQINEWLDERARQEARILKETAEILEERGSPAAGIARKAADMVEQD